MIKIEKALLFVIVLVLLVGAASATETPHEDQIYNDETVASDMSTVSQDNNKIINNEKNKVLDENPRKKIDETKKRSIEKKTENINLKKDSIIEVHNYTELLNAVNNASNAGNSNVNTTICLLEGSYNNTETVSWWTNNSVLTIDGNGQTINGHQQQVFLISAGTYMILKNITITNATGQQGGAINNFGTLNVTDSTFTNNNANEGGGIRNEGILNIINSTFTNNTAVTGGAINDKTDDNWTNIISSNFINNTANQGAAIQARGWVNLTNNTFKENTATKVKETIELFGYWNGLFEGNIYESTDVALDEIKLTVNNNQATPESVELNYTIKPVNSYYYKDFETGINDITLYIDGEKYNTTKYENTTLTDLPAGKHEAYFTSCNRQSNIVTFNIIGDSQITTPEKSYEYYEGINNKIPLLIIDASGEKGNITITVKDQDEYKLLSAYNNIGNNYQLPTESLIYALKNLYNPLSDSYTINITYSSECTNPSSTEFTLNINKQKNTTIVYNILNNTEGNVQINITVQDAIDKIPIQDANIKITGDITKNTTTGIIKDNTLTSGEYKITVQYPQTDDYKESNATINFKVEIDKDKKIADLEEKVENLTGKLEQSQAKIENLTKQLEQANQKIENLNETIKELTQLPLNTTITINPIKSSIGSVTKITANLIDENGDKVNGGKAIFKINGITLKDENGNTLYAQVNNGIASLNYKVQNSWIKNNTYLEAVYSGNENYTSSRIKASNVLNITKGKSTITLEKKNFIAKAGQTITLRAKVLDANGDRINGDRVIFKLNGVTLKDANGNALYAQV
ncbi:MAG: hypothetical protein E7Z86_10605, partial [Methanosphaera stadtmanae]|nr:hypothetical protein [Methanosphaera stadtmanae]